MLRLDCIDCMQLMKCYPDKYFDLAIVDPPYTKKSHNVGFPGATVSTTGVSRNNQLPKQWEPPGRQYFSELSRVSRHQIIWGANYFSPHIHKPGRLIWDKKNDSSSFSDAEIASISLIQGVRMFRYRWNGMIQEDMKNKEIRIHPTQKPVALYRWILEKYAKPGWKILDTHLGSASIAIACIDLGFDLYASELDQDIFKKAKKRIRTYIRQNQVRPI